MKKQAKEASKSTGLEDRYYIQCLSAQIFLVRERVSLQEKQSPHDRLVRSFAFRQDAEMCAEEANEQQKQLDHLHGQWTRSMFPQELS